MQGKANSVSIRSMGAGPAHHGSPGSIVTTEQSGLDPLT